MPMTFGRGLPERSSCSRMYCFSSRLTVCQSRCCSSATSLIVRCGNVRRCSGQSAGCAERSRGNPPAARASRCRSGDSGRAAPPDPGKCGAFHREGPAPVAACGRTSRNAPFRRSRRPFFSPPHERDESCLRITEQTLHRLQGAKTREPICVRKAAHFACFRHRAIMPKSRTPAANILCCKNRVFSTTESWLLPTRNHEEPTPLVRLLQKLSDIRRPPALGSARIWGPTSGDRGPPRGYSEHWYFCWY